MYTTNMAAWMEDITTDEISYGADISVYVYQPDDWETTVTSWFKVLKPTQNCFTRKNIVITFQVVPWGARRLVNWIKNTYGDEKGIIVTENGYHDNGNVMEDLNTRGRYHKVSCSLDITYFK